MARRRPVSRIVELWLSPSQPAGGAMPPSYYEIRVVGVLPPEALLDFERLSASVDPVETVLHGPLRAQAALHGLLARVGPLVGPVAAVPRLRDPDPQTPR